MSETGTSIVERRRRKLWLLAKETGLTTEERMEWSTYLLRRDITSWVGLTDDQVLRLLDGLESFQLLTGLLAMRPGALPPDRDTVP